jgi:hypothetical protein
VLGPNTGDAPRADKTDVADKPAALSVHEHYGDYRPPHWVKQTVDRLLRSLSSAHVGGLSAVVLTESSKAGKGRAARARGRKTRLRECLGYYRGAHAGEPAAVFLIVDNILKPHRRFLWLPFVREAILGNVLYHEIGHHLHATVGSQGAGDEASAEAWNGRLTRMHMRKRYWYLRPLRWPAGVLLRALRRGRAQDRTRVKAHRGWR